MKVIYLIISLTLSQFTLAIDCPQGSLLVRGYPRPEYYRSDGTHVTATEVAPYCRQFTSKKPLKLKFEINMPKKWPHQNEKFKKWTRSEKKEISDIFSKLPKILTEIGDLHLHRAEKSIYANNPATSAPEIPLITIYDSIKKNDYARTLTHELAHILYSNFPNDILQNYLRTANWRKGIDGNYITKRTQFSEEDGQNDPDEDFANNVEHYYHNQKAKEVLGTEIYSFLEKILGNKK